MAMTIISILMTVSTQLESIATKPESTITINMTMPLDSVIPKSRTATTPKSCSSSENS